MPTHENATLDRILRHMAWANESAFRALAQLSDGALAHTAAGSAWSVGAIAHHLVVAAENYAQRLHGEPRAAERLVPTLVADIAPLAAALAAADARLREGSALDGDEVVRWTSRSGEPLAVPRWVLIAQAVHHATEHRAQIAGALAAHGITLDLDALDVWTYNDGL